MALRLQYDYTGFRPDQAIRALARQAGFTF
jgi:hypothetical protein